MRLDLNDGNLVFLISAPLAMNLATTHHAYVLKTQEEGHDCDN